MTFTESVNLVTAASGWSTAYGATVPTPDPTVDGHTVTWPMPADLPEGAYVVTWRVVSADGHPVSGASPSGSVPPRPPCPTRPRGTETPGTTGNSVATGSTAPWPVVVIRLAGYVAFALFAGVAAFVLLCAPGTSKDPTLQLVARGGLLGGAVAAVAAILVQGPYTAGVSMSRVLDMRLIQADPGDPVRQPR